MPEQPLPLAEPKPGIKTTEFWLTATVSGVALLAFVGVIGPGESTELETGLQLIADGVRQVIAGLLIVVPILKYTADRSWVKIQTFRGRTK